MEEAWTVNHAVDGSSLSCVNVTKNLQQVFNLKIAGLLGSRSICGHINDPPLSSHSHIWQMLRLPGAVSRDVLRFVSLRITLTVPKLGHL